VGPVVIGPAPRGWRQAVVSGLSVLVAALIAGLAVWNLKPMPARPVTRTVITLPQGLQLAGLGNGPALSVSPDGSYLAYAASQGDGAQQLYLRAMDGLDAKPIPGTEGAIEPFFSPDGREIGFFTSRLGGGELKRVSLSGGAPVALGDVAAPHGASWSSQGRIAFVPSFSSLQQVSETGGAPQPLTRLEKGEVTHGWPEFLPGGKALLFTAATGSTDPQLGVQLIGTGERRNLIAGGSPRYARSGHLVYAQAGNLMAVPFDPQRLTVTGAPVSVVAGVVQISQLGAAQYSLSATGSLVYVSGTGIPPAAPSSLVWVDRKGLEQTLPQPARVYSNPRLSPDGQRVAVLIRGPEEDIWVGDVARGTLTRLTSQGTPNLMGAWTPNGKRIAFASFREGQRTLWWQSADGSGAPEHLARSEHLAEAPTSWAPNGQLLAFEVADRQTRWDIWVLRMSDRKAESFLRTPFNEGAPRFSPDGHWLAYVSDESGRFEIYVQPYPGRGGKTLISTDGGTEPVWNPTGRELFYRSGNKMMAVDVVTQPSFVARRPRMLFEGQYKPTGTTMPEYDVSPDGQHFLMLRPSERVQATPTQINVVLNWFEELNQKVPAGPKP
jgi:eukaryotic-like serine/threonine-protein kinase